MSVIMSVKTTTTPVQQGGYYNRALYYYVHIIIMSVSVASQVDLLPPPGTETLTLT